MREGADFFIGDLIQWACYSGTPFLFSRHSGLTGVFYRNDGRWGMDSGRCRNDKTIRIFELREVNRTAPDIAFLPMKSFTYERQPVPEKAVYLHFSNTLEIPLPGDKPLGFDWFIRKLK